MISCYRFFGPTLQSLIALDIYSVRVLCLSTGNADGLGSIRKDEMVSACAVFKVPANNVKILDDANLQDGSTQLWKLGYIAKLVRQEVLDHNIDYVLTFDKHGVSGHPNHIAVCHGVRTFLMENKVRLLSQPFPQHNEVEGWELVSKSILRKYSGPIEVLVAFVERCWCIRERLHVFVSPSASISVGAMKQHTTQWLWFRRLFIIFAAYTYVNTLKRTRV
eukprot:TRINITY_DN3581_c0_g1_i3.p1 TRINITY_DN3581_c0_g1~~TRINITY_DN3581_c0_g1_i3.p1  ORF type:complete len:220 (+),score=26.95 TRINITY_DN3581_c0_g1_i3:342-1001(+)